ncbi:MAG: hypothetical protein H5T86_04905 [Armatimonadetes bacterium]|nr:hypothetical protein [Armatimonadota bacterium]
MLEGALLLFSGLLLAQPGDHVPRTVLRAERTYFTINGKQVFLLGCSYYGALSAPDAWIKEDLTRLRDLGFNWVRIWATWTAGDSDVSVVDRSGLPREPWLSRLKAVLEFCDGIGMVVDVTFSRGRSLPDHQAHLAAVREVARALKPYRNAYFDLANERNIRDDRYVSMEELGELREAVKAVDPGRLVTASHAGDIPEPELKRYINVARVDFVAPHRPREPGSPAQTESKTRWYLDALRRLGRLVPVHYQEPFRRDFNPKVFQPQPDDFLTDALGALRGGAAGWCLHMGDNRARPDRRPRRDFDMRPEEGRLFDQIDDVEREVMNSLARHLGLR